MERERVTYVLPSYNHEKFIKQTIDSVLNQSYDNIELIVCDDCSTDGTPDFLEKYSKEKNFIYVRNEMNIGATKTVNKLISMATGDYIGFLASDDWIDTKKTEHQLQYIRRNKVDGVFGPVMKYFEKTGDFKKCSLDHLIPFFDTPDGYLKHLYRTDEDGALMQSGLFNTEGVRKVGYLENYKSEDWLFEIRFLQSGYKVGFLNEYLTYYRIHNENTHSRALYCLNELELPVIHDFIPKEFQRDILANVYASAALKLIDQKETKKSLSLQIKSLRYRITFQNVKRFFKADIRRILIKLNLYKLYWKLRYKTEL